MANPFVGEIRIVGFNFAPQGWAFCHGQLLSIAENDVLFTLIGTTYGGDGQSTFALPDLRGRAPLHVGNSLIQGQLLGEEGITLNSLNLPTHTHALSVSSGAASTANPTNAFVASAPAGVGFSFAPAGGPTVPMSSGSAAATGGNQPHQNMQPFLVVNYIISLFGVFPSQN
ncbi:MAG TPA: tail fiber protein [Capsulimonadaceae bacterium]|jgi:microcystin-dependent protein